MAVVAWLALAPRDVAPRFELVQPELFGVTGGQPNAWADFDNDGDLDLFVAFRDSQTVYSAMTVAVSRT